MCCQRYKYKYGFIAYRALKKCLDLLLYACPLNMSLVALCIVISPNAFAFVFAIVGIIWGVIRIIYFLVEPSQNRARSETEIFVREMKKTKKTEEKLINITIKQ